MLAMVVMMLSMMLVIPRVLSPRGLVIHAESCGGDAVHDAGDSVGSCGDDAVHHASDSAGSEPAGPGVSFMLAIG